MLFKMMRAKQYSKPLLYLVLLISALVYVKSSIDEYMRGRTFYSETRKPITVHDIPTLTICHDDIFMLGMQYWLKQISIYYQDGPDGPGDIIGTSVGNSQSVENNLPSRKGINTLKMSVLRNAFWSKRCYKLSTILNKHTQLQHPFMLRISFDPWENNSSDFQPQMYPQLYFTSEQNSYGSVYEKWYDGEVNRHILHLGEGYKFLIEEVTEYFNLDGTCSVLFFQHLDPNFRGEISLTSGQK